MYLGVLCGCYVKFISQIICENVLVICLRFRLASAGSCGGSAIYCLYVLIYVGFLIVGKNKGSGGVSTKQTRL